MDNINVKISGHAVYKAVQNFLVNEQQITKSYIEQEVEKRLDRIIGQHIQRQFEASSIISLIKQSIADYFKRGVPSNPAGGWSNQHTIFDKWLKEQLREVIREEVLKQYTIVLRTDNAFDVEKKDG